MKTGIDQALISKYESEERIIPTETLILLADFFSVSLDYMLCRTEEPRIAHMIPAPVDRDFFISCDLGNKKKT